VDVSLDLYAGSAAHPAGPYGLGQRVPMLVVSPWSKGGWVCSEVFDHTSIIRFVERRFGVHEPNISPWRRAVCGDLTSAFDFARIDGAVPSLPDTAGYLPPDRDRHPDYVPAVPANPKLPKQEPGLRPARPLPYDLAADAKVANGNLTVTFANHGKAGATFYVTAKANPLGPWTYTVEAGKELTADFGPALAGYDFTVHGPAGFVRQFKGAAAGVEVTVRHDAGTGQLKLVVTNDGAATVRLTVTDAYRKERLKTLVVRPRSRTTQAVDTRNSHGWYDVSVASTLDGAFLRRLAGHVETGCASTSDPAFITD
jgi:phospholipase C